MTPSPHHPTRTQAAYLPLAPVALPRGLTTSLNLTTARPRNNNKNNEIKLMRCGHAALPLTLVPIRTVLFNTTPGIPTSSPLQAKLQRPVASASMSAMPILLLLICPGAGLLLVAIHAAHL